MSAGRALVVSPRLPEFDRESGLLRISHLVEMLLDRDWEVTFGCLRTPTDPERYAHVLEQLGVETHAPLQSIESIRDPSGINLAILAFWHVGERFLPELRAAAPSARVVVDSVDLHFVREMRQQLRYEAGSPPGQIETATAESFGREINAYAAADAVLTVSGKEAALIDDLTAAPGHALSLPDTEELPRSPVPLRDRRGILFLGNFLHGPNRDAASYLSEEIVPRIDGSLLAEHPLSIVGTAAEEHVGPAALEHVTTVGWVPSVLPYLNSARVSIVPLRYGAGTKRKIVQALMVGTPTVTTTVGAEGLGLRDGREALIADDPYALAAGVERLLQRSLAWRGLARRGRRHVLGLHGRGIVEKRFDEVLKNVLSRPVRPAVAMPARDGEVGADGVVRSPKYTKLVARVREVVESEIPRDARVLVATRGDEALLAFEGRRGWHFPRESSGRYAGHYPADSETAIAHLEQMRALGATHLVLPETGFWWLGHYEGFHKHLETAGRRISSDAHVIVYELGARPQAQVVPAPGPEATPDLVRDRQPSALGAASRYRNGDGARRALVCGVYLADKPNTAAHIAGVLARSCDVEVDQRWAALGEAGSGELADVTAIEVGEPTPKYALLNRLLAAEDLDRYDFVLTTDDDIVLPEAFLDLFLGVQAGLGFDLAQPARTQSSYVDHPIVIQQRGVVARRTLFVEIGPLVSFGRDVLDLVLPFDEDNPMGWGFENVWSHLMRERGSSTGIVDAVPVDHSIRKPVAHYEWADAVADRERYLASHPHLPMEECFRVLEVIGEER